MAVNDRGAARLAEIGALLGCPVETFSASSDILLDMSLTHELLTVWSTIREPQARRRILELIRVESAKGISASEAAE